MWSCHKLVSALTALVLVIRITYLLVNPSQIDVELPQISTSIERVLVFVISTTAVAEDLVIDGHEQWPDAGVEFLGDEEVHDAQVGEAEVAAWCEKGFMFFLIEWKPFWFSILRLTWNTAENQIIWKTILTE